MRCGEWGDSMGKFNDDAKCGVITIRVTEAEKKTIHAQASDNKLNVTQLIGELIFSSGLLAHPVLQDKSHAPFF